jgi:hypothetical protein
LISPLYPINGGEVPDHVCLIACGPSRAVWINDQTGMNPQFTPDAVWSLNSGMSWLGNVDLVFYMDDMLEQYNGYPGTAEKMRRCKVPIITTVVYDLPGVTCPIHAFPLQEVLDHVGHAQAYFPNSVPYIMAYALTIGVKKLQMFGVDYHYDGIDAYERGRGAAEFWAGFLLAKGVCVQVPENSTLLDACKGRPFYGYLRQPIFREQESND